MTRQEITREFLKEPVRSMGSKDFDAESFFESDSYTRIVESCKFVATEQDEGSADVLAYWEDKGLKKELHGRDRWETTWASFLPMRYVRGEAEGETFPLLFVLHGHANPIFLAEAYGYNDIAAREELIVIIPNNENADHIEELFAYAKEHYPVDWTRVYMVGFSLGGFMTTRHSLRWPERFAAVGVGGMLFANGVAGDALEHDDFLFPGEPITEEMIAHATEIKLPVCECMGEHEMIDLLPLYRDPGTTPEELEAVKKSPIDWSGENKIASVNNWRRIAGCGPVSREDAIAAAKKSADIVVEKLGYPFEETRVVKLENRSHYIGDCVNAEGENLARFIAVEKIPHFPTPASCELIWEFISRFARDPETHELIVLNQ